MSRFQNDILEDILKAIREFTFAFEKRFPVAASSKIVFLDSKGDPVMPASAHVNDKPGKYQYQEFDGPNGTGNKVPPTGAVVYAIDNPAVATIDPASGQLTYVGAGLANISASDGGNLPASDALTLSAAPAVSSTITFTPGQ